MIYFYDSNDSLIRDINNYLINEFNKNGIKAYLISDISEIKDNNSIFVILEISDEDEMGSEIIYPLRRDSVLVRLLENSLNNILTFNKVYQLRDSVNTNKDFYELLENDSNYSFIFRLGYDNDRDDLNKKVNDIKRIIFDTLFNYIKGNNYYIVRSGDSLTSISKKFNISVNELREYNDITKDNLMVNEVLIIPNKSINSKTYVVVSGDSLYSISRRFNISVDELKRINGLSSNLLSIGQIIKLDNNSNIISDSNNTYVVKKGDSLYSISRRFNISVDELKRINGLSSNLLSIGQIIKLDNSSNIIIDSNNTYVVKKGDSLYSISRMYNVSVDELKRINGLSSNLLSIGQIIKIRP